MRALVRVRVEQEASDERNMVTAAVGNQERTDSVRCTERTMSDQIHTPPPTWIPPMSCGCGARHHVGAQYYASVTDGPDRVILAAGPYRTHQEALAVVNDVWETVTERYGESAHWYAYGTVAMPFRHTEAGKLNAAVAERIARRVL